MAGRFISDHSTCGEADIFRLANTVASEAITDAGWDFCGRGGPPLSPLETQGRAAPATTNRTALVVGTSKGPIKSWIDRHDIAPGLSGVAESLHPLMPFCNSLTLSAACASGLHALIRGVLMIQNGEVDRVLVVAAEASVHPLFVGSFQRLGVLARPTVGCRPFDRDREGFLMSEAAAAVCLERGDGGYATIDQFGFGGDSTNLVSSDPQAKTLRRLLKQVVASRSIDVIHSHGTGTVVNDAIELNAIESVTDTPSPGTPEEGEGGSDSQSRMLFGGRNHPRPNLLQGYREKGPEDAPILYSHKAAIGHSLGAAGLVAVVLNALMHRHGVVPGNVRTLNAMRSKMVISKCDSGTKSSTQRCDRLWLWWGGGGGGDARSRRNRLNQFLNQYLKSRKSNDLRIRRGLTTARRAVSRTTTYHPNARIRSRRVPVPDASMRSLPPARDGPATACSRALTRKIGRTRRYWTNGLNLLVAREQNRISSVAKQCLSTVATASTEHRTPD